MGSRIVFACDAYDALTTSRPYSRPMSPEQAARELRASAGTQFDPQVVETLLAVLGTRELAAAR